MTIATKTHKVANLARFVGQQASRSGGLRRLRTAGATTWGHFRKVLGQLWLEVTGFVFLALAVIGAAALVREYFKLHSGSSNSGRVALAVGFTLMFGWFGVSSFWRVRNRNQTMSRLPNGKRDFNG